MPVSPPPTKRAKVAEESSSAFVLAKSPGHRPAATGADVTLEGNDDRQILIDIARGKAGINHADSNAGGPTSPSSHGTVGGGSRGDPADPKATKGKKKKGAEKKRSLALDMFDDGSDVDDDTLAELSRHATAAVAAVQGNANADSSYDDPDGYYSLTPGEVLLARYRVVSQVGRGVFSSVLLCEDLGAKDTGKANASTQGGNDGSGNSNSNNNGNNSDGNGDNNVGDHSKGNGDCDGSSGNGKNAPRRVCVKVIRANPVTAKAGREEIAVLRALASAAGKGSLPGRDHIVNLEATFEYRGHLCLVFEPLRMNLREVLREFGGGVGLDLGGVVVYTRQLLAALAVLQAQGIVHADIKPDNACVDERLSRVKLIDFGTAVTSALPPEMASSSYMVSRFYRPPEVILGLGVSHAADVWALGCTMLELWTGRVVFPGRDNHDMLRVQMECRGKVPHKMIRRAPRGSAHFDTSGSHMVFHGTGGNPLPEFSVRSKVRTSASKADDEDLLAGFTDLLEKMLAMDPGKRPGATELLGHPVFAVPSSNNQ